MAAINLRVPLGLVPLTNQQVDDNFQNIINAIGANGSTTIPTPTGTGSPVLSASPTLTGTLTTANITYTGTLTGGTGVVNIGSNQIYKDASGNIGLGLVPSGTYKLETSGSIYAGSVTFSSLTTSGIITANTTTNSQIYTTTGAGTITISSGTTGNINNMNIGGTIAGTGTFSTLAYTGTLTGSTGVVNIGSGQFYKDASGNIAIGATSSSVKLSIIGTDAIKVPIGTTAQRPTGAQGYIRFNSDLSQFEGHNGTAWTSVGGGATGGAGNYIFYENDITVTQNYTITTNKNAMTAGPITINNGVIITVPDNSVWTIV